MSGFNLNLNDPNTFNQHKSWVPVTLPNGSTYYEVPGTGYVYDPVMSQMKGRPVLFNNPKTALERKREEEKAIKEANDPINQLAPVAGTVGGLWAANKIAGMGSGAAAAETGAAASGGASATGAAAAEGAFVGPQLPGFGTGVLSNAGSMGFGPMAAIAGSTYLGGEAAYDMLKGRKPGTPGRVILGMATGGLSEVANKFLGHESTRDHARKNTSRLQGMGEDDGNWQSYVAGMREQYNSAPVDPSKPFAGKYGSWNEYKSAGLEANDLTGVYGNLSTFGPEWASLSQEDRIRVTQSLIDNDLYDSKKGEVIITDPEKAREIYSTVLGREKSEEELEKEKQAQELARRADERANRR